MGAGDNGAILPRTVEKLNPGLKAIREARSKNIETAPPGKHYEFYYVPESHSDTIDDFASATREAYLRGEPGVYSVLVSDVPEKSSNSFTDRLRRLLTKRM